MTNFDAVLFDFGGVFTPSPFQVLRDAAADLGIPPEVAVATCFGGYDQDTDHPWHRLERGEVSAQEALVAIAAIAAESSYHIDPIAILRRGLGSGGLIRDDVVEVVRQVRGHGLKTAIVTNNIKEYSASWRALIPVDELFDLVIDSCEVGMRKPDPRIFQLTLDQLGGIPSRRAAFLDDAPGNVAAARSLGLHAILVQPDHTPAMEELRTLLS